MEWGSGKGYGEGGWDTYVIEVENQWDQKMHVGNEEKRNLGL